VPDIFGSVTSEIPTFGSLLLCTVFSVALGLAVAAVYMYKNKHSRTLAVTLVLLPAMVQVIIMLVNGNIGTGVAVAGAFGLIRFRSAQGNAREISCLFFAMALGFITGLGYLAYAFVFLMLIGCAFVLMSHFRFGQEKTDTRVLNITIPENLDYDGLFDEIFEKYTESAELEKVKSTNMGSLFELTYSIKLKSESVPKAFLDEIRCRNGNLNVLVSRERRDENEL